MRIAFRIMVMTAVMVIVVSSGAAAKPPTTSQGPELCFELVDGTIITGHTDIKTITIRIANGNVLKVPVADLTELTVGIKKQRGSVERTKLQSKLQMGGTILLGTVTVGQFLIASPYGRFTVKLDDIHRIRPGVRATSGKFGRLAVELRDKTHLRGMAIDQSLRVQTHYGTIDVPFAQMQKATFTTDGKSICVQCWSSDRIVGALGASATISLKTDKGRVDLSPGRIAAAAYGPLTLKGHSENVYSVAFSPDGKRLASGSMDETIKIWDILD